MGKEIYLTKNSLSQTAHILKPLLSILNTLWRTTRTLFYYIVPDFTVDTVSKTDVYTSPKGSALFSYNYNFLDSL